MGSRDNTRLNDKLNTFSEQIRELSTSVLKKSDLEPVLNKIRDDVKDMLRSFHEQIREEFKETIAHQALEIRTLNENLATTKNNVSMLNDKLAVYDSAFRNIKAEQNKAEQYSRRQSLRIHNVPMKNNETANDCLNTIKEIIAAEELDIPDSVIDRAHRVGRKNGKKPPAIIVKFTTWRHRTILYRHRNKVKEKANWTITLDLTRENMKVLDEVRRVIKRDEVEEVEFVGCDVNCQPFMCTTEEKLIRFSSVDDALSIIQKLRFPQPRSPTSVHDDDGIEQGDRGVNEDGLNKSKTL